jgi:phage terminase large subunit-like protein
MGLGLKDMSPLERIEFGQKLKARPKEELRHFLTEVLTIEERMELMSDPYLWLRPSQYIKDSKDTPIHLALCGRGWGKTFCGSRWLMAAVEEHGAKRLVMAGPTLGDIKRTMWSGESGLESAYPLNHPNRPKYLVSQSEIRFPNGAVALLIPEESMERARGHNSSHCWVDELGSFGANGEEFFESLMMGMRLAPAQTLITTTPKPNSLMIDLYKRIGEDVELIEGNTFENEEHLDPVMLNRARRLAGTRLGKQEIEGKILMTNPAALWSPQLIDDCSKPEDYYPIKRWASCCIGVDPASNRKNSDLTGIIVSIQLASGEVIIWEDCSGSYSSEQWTSVISQLYDKYSNIVPTIIVVEKNGVGALVKDVLEKQRNDWPIKDFHSQANKFARASQASYMFETGKVFLNKDAKLGDLTTEMTTWTGNTKEKSPDRLDACVFTINQLLYKKQNVTSSKEFFL